MGSITYRRSSLVGGVISERFPLMGRLHKCRRPVSRRKNNSHSKDRHDHPSELNDSRGQIHARSATATPQESVAVALGGQVQATVTVIVSRLEAHRWRRSDMHRLTAPPSAGPNPPDAGALVVGQRAKDCPAYSFDPSVIDQA